MRGRLAFLRLISQWSSCSGGDRLVLAVHSSVEVLPTGPVSANGPGHGPAAVQAVHWYWANRTRHRPAPVLEVHWSCQPTGQDTDPQQYRQYNTTMVPMDQDTGSQQYRQTFGLLYYRSLDLTLSDLPIGKPNFVQSCPTLGRVLFFCFKLSKSLKNSGKSSGFSGKICPRDVPWHSGFVSNLDQLSS